MFKFFNYVFLSIFAGNGKGVMDRGANTDSYNRISVGYNPFKVKVDIDRLDHQSINGFALEYIHGFGVSKTLPIFVEVGARLHYSAKSQDIEDLFDGVLFDESLGDVKLKHMHIAVPVNFAYRWQLYNSGVSLTPYTGLTLKINALTKAKLDYGFDVGDGYDDELLSGNETIDFFDKDDVDKDEKWNRFQVGWQIGVGIGYKAFYAGLHYGLDFGEVCKDMKTSNWGISVGYSF